MPSTPVSSDATGVPGRTSQVRSSGLGLAEVEPAGLVRGVDRGHHQAGRDEHEHDAGELEEPGQVEPDAAAVDAVAERRPRPGCRAPRRCRP